MEDINEQETIDSKYIIMEKKGHGASASVYLVKDINQQNVYAAKVLKKPSDLFQNEINMLNAVKKLNSSNIVNIINSGEGLIIRNDHPKKTSQYLVLEYAEKGELFNYIFYANDGFSERHSKLIFYKMLKGIEACHIAGVCHRDLKMQNILVDKNHCPKICDFGFATMNNGHLNQYLGTINYAAPEILRNKPYDGFKADIFSLGVVLLTLTTCKFGFQKAHKTDKYYKYIMLKYFDEYWDEVSKKIKPISKELKDLFINMVAYKPNERPSIKEILNSEWMKEIRDMNAEQLEQLENEVREEFLKREPLVKEGLSKEMEVEESSSGESSGNRGGDDNEEFFDLNLKPKYAQTGLNMNNYIKLTGNLNPSIFMNSLANKIIKEYKSENCYICPIQDKLKFNVIFNNEKSDVDDDIPENMKEEFKKLGIEENDNIAENENILGLKTVIQIKMYESYNGGYLLRFVKKDGDLCDYLNKIEKIYSLIKENKN